MSHKSRAVSADLKRLAIDCTVKSGVSGGSGQRLDVDAQQVAGGKAVQAQGRAVGRAVFMDPRRHGLRLAFAQKAGRVAAENRFQALADDLTR